MFTAVLIDDEINALKMLELELKDAFPLVKVLATFQNPLEASSFIQLHKPNILFIDIEMPHMNGIDFVRQLDVSFAKVIFLTAYKQYAIDAVRSNAIDYLLKPLDTNEFKIAVNRAIEKIKDDQERNFEKAFFDLKGNANQLKIPTTNGFAFLKINEIIYCKSDSNYTHIFTTSKTYIVSKTLKFIQSALPKDSFLRIHNSYLVNADYISEYSRKDGGYVVLTDGTSLRVSNSRKDIFNV